MGNLQDTTQFSYGTPRPPQCSALRVFVPTVASFSCGWSIFCCLVRRKKVKNVLTLLPPCYFKHLMSIQFISKIATLSVVSTLLYHRSYRVLDPYRPFWIFMEVSADNSFPDFRCPFPAPRSPLPVPRSPFPAPRSPFPVLVTSGRAPVSCFSFVC